MKIIHYPTVLWFKLLMVTEVLLGTMNNIVPKK